MRSSKGVNTILNSQTGDWTETYTRGMNSFGIYNCTLETTITLDEGLGTELVIVTSDSWDDEIYAGFTTIKIETLGVYNLVVRG